MATWLFYRKTKLWQHLSFPVWRHPWSHRLMETFPEPCLFSTFWKNLAVGTWHSCRTTNFRVRQWKSIRSKSIFPLSFSVYMSNEYSRKAISCEDTIWSISILSYQESIAAHRFNPFGCNLFGASAITPACHSLPIFKDIFRFVSPQWSPRYMLPMAFSHYPDVHIIPFMLR